MALSAPCSPACSVISAWRCSMKQASINPAHSVDDCSPHSQSLPEWEAKQKHISPPKNLISIKTKKKKNPHNHRILSKLFQVCVLFISHHPLSYRIVLPLKKNQTNKLAGFYRLSTLFETWGCECLPWKDHLLMS